MDTRNTFNNILQNYIINRRRLYYAGIGSRKTPKHVLALMTKISDHLFMLGAILRTGGADGPDTAFAQGSHGRFELYLPKQGFNGCTSKCHTVSADALQIAAEIHPAWDRCSVFVKKLHGRNVYQVLGYDIAPATYSAFVICWTPNGKAVGGTRTAIKLAEKYNIPVFNLANEEVYTYFKELVEKED